MRYILSRFSPKLRNYLYPSYFSADIGMGYNLLRLPIGGTQFELEPWTNDMQSEPDPNLLHFTELNPRDKLQNTQFKEMQQITGNSDIRFIGAVWSPPLWMKAKYEWYGTADNQVKPEYYQALANYHARWLNLTAADGISI